MGALASYKDDHWGFHFYQWVFMYIIMSSWVFTSLGFKVTGIIHINTEIILILRGLWKLPGSFSRYLSSWDLPWFGVQEVPGSSCMFSAPKTGISPFSQEPGSLGNGVERSQSAYAPLGTKSIGLFLVVHFVYSSYVLSSSAWRF